MWYVVAVLPELVSRLYRFHFFFFKWRLYISFWCFRFDRVRLLGRLRRNWNVCCDACILKGEDIRVCEGVCVSDLGVGAWANIFCMPGKRKKGSFLLATELFFFSAWYLFLFSNVSIFCHKTARISSEIPSLILWRAISLRSSRGNGAVCVFTFSRLPRLRSRCLAVLPSMKS